MSNMSKSDIKLGITRLRKRLAEVENFDEKVVVEQFGDPAVVRIRTSVGDAIQRTFAKDETSLKAYSSAATFDTGPIRIGGRSSIAEVRSAVAQSRARSIVLLEQAIASLEERLEEYELSHSSREIVGPEGYARKAFVVHGHDEGAIEGVARFLERLSFDVIILAEQANRGMTIIEKIEAESDVGFAIVLLTPDDVGSKRGDSELVPRARQNVLLELGYFMGKLGRDRVCALRKGGVELPSDFAGVVWQELDNGKAWRQAIAKELSAAGYAIDWNVVMT